ncbi:hypothetical protein Ancab_017970 [Ancistrocladus abbreviatus]
MPTELSRLVLSLLLKVSFATVASTFTFALLILINLHPVIRLRFARLLRCLLLKLVVLRLMTSRVHRPIVSHWLYPKRYFPWSKPIVVISGINKGSNCGQNMLCSGAVAGAREALIWGVPSLCISLSWKKDVSSESDFKDAADVCLPLVHAAIRDIERGVFPKSCLLNIEIPVSPSGNKGYKVTRQSLWRSGLSWQAVSSHRHPSAGHFMSSQQSLGIQLAQLGRDASAAGAARRLNTKKQNVEIESVGVAGKPSSQQTVRKYYRLELMEKEQEIEEDDFDFRALENGFVAITPLALSLDVQSQVQSSVSNWLAAVLSN